MRFAALLRQLDRVQEPATARAHCDLPCGVYDPAQARIEGESVHGIQKKYQDASDEEFKQRAIQIKEQRAELVKYHLWVLWTDYFKPHHLEAYPDLHEKFWQATKSAGEAKKSTDPSQGQKLLDQIDEIANIFWETKKAG
ncbi:MAG: superoxide dismutase, Ni [Actinobacteria bacterium QS_8_72_14]|jgi:nickel superoxide dismutase|nr:MAG: superoxide dismutase, Ni [Actinobacteria bacterium QS_8_72_14]